MMDPPEILSTLKESIILGTVSMILHNGWSWAKEEKPVLLEKTEP
jgi:hypothetical protein